ncbi:glycosyltransferase family 2 protein [Roseovarius sp. A21]|uniref:Glycosyltransferase family 2 protein n=1 Tax=Roseovarius bejariae TaxID=2576383 RepID=A0A844CHX4_9RHOB|nr:glycosyltransferase family 2 protein [Roseovarius bejariae]MRU14921.1 glycosyltransferase family 2 protein [Roseovarius bejariae]
MTAPQIAFVVPAHNEAGNLPTLLNGLRKLARDLDAEVLVVNDGSTDETAQLLGSLARDWPQLRIVTHSHALGQSAALRTGIRMARAPIIATLDGDGQNPPENLRPMIATFQASPPSVGMIQGLRAKRRDSLSKRLASRSANAIRGALLRDGCKDSGCALRVFWRQAYLDLPWFQHLHRFMPALMKRDGWEVVTMPVSHAPRASGQSHYTNWQRGLAGLPDLLGVAWLIWRSPKRIHYGCWWASQSHSPECDTRPQESAPDRQNAIPIAANNPDSAHSS